MTSAEFAATRLRLFESHLTAALKILCEQKHLYQSVLVDRTDSYLVIQLDQTRKQETNQALSKVIDAGWALDLALRPGAVAIHVKMPDIKVFCTPCNRVEAFNPVFGSEVFKDIGQFADRKGAVEQAFLLGYQCQSCKKTPELFLVRRTGLRLTNVGRAPIEHVDVPAYVPKSVRRFLSGAIVAHQSGQTLAGVFLLRTLLEQWARSTTSSKKEFADQVIEDYMASLPDDFKGRFPSMRTLYAELSVDIHRASGSAELFEKARGQINQHFEARRIFGLPEMPAEQSDPAPDLADSPLQ